MSDIARAVLAHADMIATEVLALELRLVLPEGTLVYDAVKKQWTLEVGDE